jgi:hypothetical protein
MSQLDTADRQTAAGEEPSETVLLTSGLRKSWRSSKKK